MSSLQKDPGLLSFSLLHISPPNQQPSIHCSGCWAAAWLLQQMPSAGPKPRRLEKILFKVTAACVMSPKCPVHAHWSQALDWTNFWHHTLMAPTLPRFPCPQAPGTAWLPRHLCSSIPHISDCDNKTPDVVISAHHFPGHKRSKLGYFPARQACWAVGRAEIRCWKTEERTRGEEHVKERSKDACNLNNLNSQQFQSLFNIFHLYPPP